MRHTINARGTCKAVNRGAKSSEEQLIDRMNPNPTHRLNSERIVIGYVLLSPDASMRLLLEGGLLDEDFHHPFHKAIWSRLVFLPNAGFPISVTTLKYI